MIAYRETKTTLDMLQVAPTLLSFGLGGSRVGSFPEYSVKIIQNPDVTAMEWRENSHPWSVHSLTLLARSLSRRLLAVQVVKVHWKALGLEALHPSASICIQHINLWVFIWEPSQELCMPSTCVWCLLLWRHEGAVAGSSQISHNLTPTRLDLFSKCWKNIPPHYLSQSNLTTLNVLYCPHVVLFQHTVKFSPALFKRQGLQMPGCHPSAQHPTVPYWPVSVILSDSNSVTMWHAEREKLLSPLSQILRWMCSPLLKPLLPFLLPFQPASWTLDPTDAWRPSKWRLKSSVLTPFGSRPDPRCHPNTPGIVQLVPDLCAHSPSDTLPMTARFQPRDSRQIETKISFGGIPNSSSIDILMPYVIFDYMGAFLRSSFAHVDNVIPVIKTITWLLLSRLQGNKPHRNSPEPSEPSGTFRTLPPEPTPTRAGTLQNPPEPSETFRNQPFGTFRNLPPEPTPAYTGTLRNRLELASGTYTILHRNFRNLPPEPTPAHAGTLRNLPEPSSGTCSCNPHRHTPELIWAEDPISLRCWGKKRLWWYPQQQ